MSETLQRITGTEMEWGVSVPNLIDPTKSVYLHEGELDPFIDSYLSQEDVAFVGDQPGNNSGFLGNGARFYEDVSHREYATPEDISYLGTVANEIAGERIMDKVVSPLAQQYGGYSLNKRVIDDERKTWGYHENYGIDARSLSINSLRLALHGVHLATRNIFFGAGALLTDGTYVMGQKAVDIKQESGTGNTASKAVINTRDQPEADKKLFGRVHVVCGDPNMSPWAMRMKLGTTSLVLRMLEHDNNTLKYLRFNSLRYALCALNDDIELKGAIPLTNNNVKTAIEIQTELCNAAVRFSRHVRVSDQDMWTLSEWQRACADAAQDPRLLKNRVDWMLKKDMLDRRHNRGLDWKSEDMRTIERQYSEIRPGSIADTLRDGIWKQWMPPESLIVSRMTNPPETSRAYMRGQFVQAFSKNLVSGFIAWDYIMYNAIRHAMPDPYNPRHEDLESIIDRFGQKAA